MRKVLIAGLMMLAITLFAGLAIAADDCPKERAPLFSAPFWLRDLPSDWAPSEAVSEWGPPSEAPAKELQGTPKPAAES